jgi:putative hydrolase of the HAD superfamily
LLIIFDLDDTLIDTSGSILPTKLKSALEKMVQAGLKFDNQERLLENLIEINNRSKTTKEALKEFLFLHDKNEKFFAIAMNEIYNDFDPKFIVKPRVGAIKILNELKKNHQLALVTVGKEEIQRLKLKNAGIDFSIFNIIKVIELEDKKPDYKKIINMMEKRAEETLVCGDKILCDLKPAKELGCITVHMQYGRERNYKNSSLIDFEIKELVELKNIIKNFGGKII